MKKRISKIVRRFEDWLDRQQLRALDRQLKNFTDAQVVAVIKVIAAKRAMTPYIITGNSRGQKILLINELLCELGLPGWIGHLNLAEQLLLAAQQEKRAAKRKEASLN